MDEKSSRGKKREIIKEEISNYIDQGYYFRVKKVNGKKYITRRKGREEKSLGPYTEEAWSTIKHMQNQPEDAISEIPLETAAEKTFPETLRLLEQLKEEISMSKGIIMQTSCLHNIDGICNYWHWETKPRFFETMDKLDDQTQKSYTLTDIVHKGKIEKRWAVKAHVLYCMNSPVQMRLKDIACVDALHLSKAEYWKEIGKKIASQYACPRAHTP